MPDMTPVANQVNPPDPMKGLNTFSGILGLKRQQQELQLGQQQIQAGQANLQQTQQKNTELQNLSLFVQGAIKDPQYQLPDGSPDIQKFQRDAMGVAPTYGQQYIGQTTSNFKEAVETRRSLQSLSGEQNDAISKALKGIATKPDATPTDLLDAVQQLRSNNKDPAFNRALDNFLLGANRTSPQQAAANGASMLGGLSQNAPSTQDVGGQTLTGTTKMLGPGMGTFNPSGQALQHTLSPNQQPGYLGQVATVQGAASGQVGTDNQVFSKVMSAGADSARGIELAQKVEQEAGMVRTGKFSREFADRLTVLQQHDPSVTARQLLQKDAENLKTLAEGTATTDSERQQIGAGFPSPESMDPDAVQKAARYWQGSFRMAGARRDNAVAHIGQNGSTAGLALKDSQFMSAASPGKFAPPEPKKQLPSGAKLTTYANTHFNGDTAKATAYLKQQGYE